MNGAEESHPSTTRPNLRKHIEEFSGNTTLHGAHFVIGAGRGIFRRIFWLLLILTGLGLCISRIVVSYKKLQSMDYVITKDTEHTGNRLKFPAVTICNANMMRRSKIEGTDAQVYLDQLNPFRTVLSLSNKTLDSSFDIKKAVLKYGHSASDMIDICVWDGEFCSIMTVFEIFDFIISYLFGKQKTKNQVEQDDTKREVSSST